METAYRDAAGRVNDTDKLDILGGLIGGQNLTTGVYTWTTNLIIATDITFSGGPDSTWILRTTKNVIVAANVIVTLAGGALASNIVWQVAGYVEVGAGAHMEGVILCYTKVDFLTKSSLNGRILAQTATNLQMTTITQP